MSRDREWANDWARCSGKNASYLTNYFVIPTNSNIFSDWRRTCHLSRVKLTVSLGSRTWSGRSPWTAANLWASRRQVNDFFAFFSIFELRGITKHLMTAPAETVHEFCFPSPSMLRVSWKQHSLFPAGPVIKCLLLQAQVFLNVFIHLPTKAFIWYSLSGL